MRGLDKLLNSGFDHVRVEPAVVYHITAKRQGSGVAEKSKHPDISGLAPTKHEDPGYPISGSLDLGHEKIGTLKRLKILAGIQKQSAVSSVSAAVQYELDTGLGFILVPVCLAVGIILYFLAPVEPTWFISAFIPVILVLFLKTGKRATGFHLVAFFLFALCGMLAAKVSTLRTDYPIIERQITGNITGTILAVDSNRRGSPRYVVKPFSIKGLGTGQIPERVRLSSASKKVVFEPGDLISGSARLQPVSGPVYPGGYDFSFFARQDHLGGSGFFMGAPVSAKKKQKLGIGDTLTIMFNRTRLAIAKRIESALPGPQGRVATALVIGDKTGIPADIQNSLRATGLAHILAISGLHMALVTLTVIWMVRLVLVANGSLILWFPGKKWAAAAGFLFATFYLMLSGGGVATQRAWVMISVMLCAVMLDRRAITMRSVAISAVIILLLSPASLLGPGFQMSFAAVASLVAVYEIFQRNRKSHDRTTAIWGNSSTPGLLARVSRYFGGLAMTSLIAGTATAFVAAWHFHQVPVLGLLANILAMPVVSLLVMPGVLLSLLLMPFGYEFLALYPVGVGIDMIVEVSRWVESLGSVFVVGIMPPFTLAAFALAITTFCVMKSGLRWVGLMPIAMIPVFYDQPKVPDVLIAENGRAVAVKMENQSLSLLFPKRENFVTEIWAKAYANGDMKRLQKHADACNRERCIHVLTNGLTLHIVYDPDLLNSSCQRADILVAPRLRWVNCRKRVPRLILRRGNFEERGTHALYFDQHEIRMATGLPEPTRPWHRKLTPLHDD